MILETTTEVRKGKDIPVTGEILSVRISHLRSCSSDFDHLGFVNAFNFN